MSDKVTEIVNLLTPTVHTLGLELLGIEYLPAAGSATLRLYIDLPQDQIDQGSAVGIDDCERVSREVSALLDVEDPIEGNYTLEVSSPGIDRPLFTLAHFQRYQGEQVRVGLKLPQNGRRRLKGSISRIEGDMIVFLLDNAEFEVAFENIDKARLIPDWAALGLISENGSSGSAGKAKPNKLKNKSSNKLAADKPSAE